MKKTIIFGMILLLSAGLFMGCIDSPSYDIYSEPWFETEGYVISKMSERTNSLVFVSFEEGTPPEGSKIAVRHEHTYFNRPRCTFEVQKRTTNVTNDFDHDDELYSLVTDDSKTDNFIITNKPYDKNKGFTFWCDDDTVYVVNNLYELGYTDAKSSGTAQYCFKIKINGIKELKLYMNYNSSQPY
ncbi:MAG: hypothetical protein IKR64_01545 [Treponema sp.]|nr:hypothetical protein [Treponema sp.]